MLLVLHLSLTPVSLLSTLLSCVVQLIGARQGVTTVTREAPMVTCHSHHAPSLLHLSGCNHPSGFRPLRVCYVHW
jgi:hypothetical protein